MRYIPNIPTNISMPNVALVPQDEDHLSRDEESKKQREELLKRQKWNAFFNTIKSTFTAIAAPIIGAGMGIFLPLLTDGFSGGGSQGIMSVLADAASNPQGTLGLSLSICEKAPSPPVTSVVLFIPAEVKRCVPLSCAPAKYTSTS